MDWMESLMDLVPPPGEVRHDPAWSTVEESLKVPLPADYKVFAATYGAASLWDFVWIWSPFTQNKNLDLVRGVEGQGRAYATLHGNHPAHYPLPPFPQDGSFLPWAVTDNGDYLGWIMEGPVPDTWKIAVMDDESGVPQVFDMTFGPFVLGLVAGTVVPEAFPQGLSTVLPRKLLPNQ